MLKSFSWFLFKGKSGAGSETWVFMFWVSLFSVFLWSIANWRYKIKKGYIILASPWQPQGPSAPLNWPQINLLFPFFTFLPGFGPFLRSPTPLHICVKTFLIASDLLQLLVPPSPPLEVDWMQVRALPGVIQSALLSSSCCCFFFIEM